VSGGTIRSKNNTIICVLRFRLPPVRCNMSAACSAGVAQDSAAGATRFSITLERIALGSSSLLYRLTGGGVARPRTWMQPSPCFDSCVSGLTLSSMMDSLALARWPAAFSCAGSVRGRRASHGCPLATHSSGLTSSSRQSSPAAATIPSQSAHLLQTCLARGDDVFSVCARSIAVYLGCDLGPRFCGDAWLPVPAL